MDTPDERSKLLVEVFKKYIPTNFSILEIGCGNERNLKWLRKSGYTKVYGIDKLVGHSIEEYKEKPFDVIFTMSTLFLIPEESEWVFEKISRMAQKFIITFEGETTKKEIKLIGRNYKDVFGRFGFEQIEHRENVFNEFGHLRVLKK